MKHLVALLCLVTPLCAQWIVHDPGNTAVNAAVQAGQAANHLEVLRQWAQQLENLNRQLRQLEDQLAVQRRIRDVMGDPSVAGVGVVLHGLGADDLARLYGENLATVRRLANAVESLRRTSDGIYRQLDDRTSLGRSFERAETVYRRYAAVERQADVLTAVQEQTDTRLAALQADLAETLAQLRRAETQAEVDKLSAKIAALNGQISRVETQRHEEAEKLRTQQLLNENQAAKERQDLLERQLAEEAHSLSVVGAWQQGLKISPSNYTKP